MNQVYYDWFGNTTMVANTEEGAGNKADYRLVPDHENLVQRCSAHLKNTDHKQENCMWFRKSSYGKVCMYDRFGLMCDKLVVDQKGMN